MTVAINTVFRFFLTYLPPPQAIEAVPLSWAFCENCLSAICEFFHSMMTALNRWAPLCSLQGRSGRGGLFWVLFWAVAKKCLARGANTAMPNEITTVNAEHMKHAIPITPTPTSTQSTR